MKKVFRLPGQAALTEQSDLDLNCLLGHKCHNIQDCYGSRC